MDGMNITTETLYICGPPEPQVPRTSGSQSPKVEAQVPRTPRSLSHEVQLPKTSSDFEPTDLPVETPRPCTPRLESPYLQPPYPPSDLKPTGLPLGFTYLLRELSNVHNGICVQRRVAEDKLEKANEELIALRLKLEEKSPPTAQPPYEKKMGHDMTDTLDRPSAESSSSKKIHQRPFLSSIGRDMTETLESPSAGSSSSKKVHKRATASFSAFVSSMGHDTTTDTLDSPSAESSSSKKMHKRGTASISALASSSSRNLKGISSESFTVEAYSRNSVAAEFALMKGWKSYEPRFSECSHDVPQLSRSFTDVVVGIVQSHIFENFATVAIATNSILVGLAVDHAARNRLQLRDNPVTFKVAERIFTILFACELALRLLGGFRFFCTGNDKWWNIFDLIVVVGDISQTVLESIVGGGTANISSVRVMRVVRITRAIRVIRLVRFFKHLRMMIYSILRCSTSLLWSLLLFLMMFYVFGVFLMTQVADFMGKSGSSNPRINDLREFFGDIPRSMLSLFASMSGGISWKLVSDALNAVHWTNGVALAFFVFFSLFVVSNIVTGIFVDQAIQSAQTDREEVIQEQLALQDAEMLVLKQIFAEADKDSSGNITLEEFEQHLGQKEVRAHLNVLGIQVNEAYGLFKLLDQDDSGQVNIDEFVLGCLRLKGGAKGIDLATLMYENKKLVEHIVGLDRLCVEQFNYLRTSHETLLHYFRSSPVSQLATLDV